MDLICSVNRGHEQDDARMGISPAADLARTPLDRIEKNKIITIPRRVCVFICSQIKLTTIGFKTIIDMRSVMLNHFYACVDLQFID